LKVEESRTGILPWKEEILGMEPWWDT